MKYQTEAELMKALKIDSWRNLSRPKMIRFASMMPDMDTELALKVVEQFPEFKAFALDMLKVIEKQHESTLGHNQQSQESFQRSLVEARKILKGELDKDSLSSDDRKYVLDLIMQTLKLESDKDTENKAFLDGLFKKVAFAGLGVVALGVAFVGGRMLLEDGDLDDIDRFG